MNVAIDIGNTQLKFGVFEGTELKEVLLGENALSNILMQYNLEHAIISQTGSNDFIQQQLRDKGVNTLFLSPKLKLPLKVRYKTPDTLGADRLAASVACNFTYPNSNILKIDFGTCITYDFITATGEYIGGAISPGMMMRFKSLHNYTAKLPLVDPMQFAAFDLTGTDTTTSIASGVVNGIKEEVNGIIKEYDARFGNLKVVATGGDSGLFVTLLKCEIFARPYLVLEGLNLILNYNL
ncbi:MAG: type III pantothenate kinase [Chitinophagales bacterium]|nr:type III pantothenate kinase [Chitinophagales bacterium]